MNVRSESKRGPRRLAWKVLLVLVLAGLGLELGLRLVRYAQGDPYGTWRTEQRLREKLFEMSLRVPIPGEDQFRKAPENEAIREVLHPYYGFEPAGYFQQIHDELAYFLAGGGESSYDILLVGGSVAAGFGYMGRERFLELLAEDPRFAGRNVRLLRYARGAFKQPQQVNVVTYLLSLGFEPDAVLCIDGFNEVALANGNAHLGAHPVYPALPQWAPVATPAIADDPGNEHLARVRELRAEAAALVRRARHWHLTWSAVLGELVTRRFEAIRRDWIEAQEDYLESTSGAELNFAIRGLAFDAKRDTVMDAAVRAWSRSVEILQAICDARGIPFLDVLQPTLHDAGSKPVTEQELATGTASEAWLEAVEQGYPLLREEGRRLAERGVSFSDASRVFADVEEPLYTDACHFGQRGNELLAEHVARAFLEVVGEK